MMYVIIVSVVVLSVCHLSLGLLSVIVGMISSIHAEVWMAHSVSPIWSGAFVSRNYTIFFSETKCL